MSDPIWLLSAVERCGWHASQGCSIWIGVMRRCRRAGELLERLALVIDFELFRLELESRSDRAVEGRPPNHSMLMFKVLVLQTLHILSDEQTEYQIRDRLSFMRVLGLALDQPVKSE